MILLEALSVSVGRTTSSRRGVVITALPVRRQSETARHSPHPPRLTVGVLRADSRHLLKARVHHRLSRSGAWPEAGTKAPEEGTLPPVHVTARLAISPAGAVELANALNAMLKTLSEIQQKAAAAKATKAN
jgi:hypothetical protein